MTVESTQECDRAAVDSEASGISRRQVTAAVGRNTLFGVGASVLQVATRLVTVPIVINHLGMGGYGIWNIVLTIASYMRFGTVGIKSAFQKYVAEATGNGSYEKASKLLSTGTVGIFIYSLILLVPAAIFSRPIAIAAGVKEPFIRSSAIAVSELTAMMFLSNMASAYEAAIMGAHRIDLTRKIGILLNLLEAAFVLVVMRLGFGLAALAMVMLVSQGIYVSFCFVMSKKVIPQIHIAAAQITKTISGELVRYGGSYQLVSILQVTYGALAPIAILRVYGAEPSGIYAIASRLVSPVSMCFYAFLVPVLSGGAMIWATGSPQAIQSFLAKSFKFTLSITLLPLALMCAFGPDIIRAWTGHTDPHFGVTLALVAAATTANCFALLGLVLYRASGKTIMDNLREVFRILLLLPVVFSARKLGFLGVLAGIGAVEGLSALFIIVIVKKTFPGFRLRQILTDVVRLVSASFIMVGTALVVAHFATFTTLPGRLAAAARLGLIGIAILCTIYPALFLTKFISKTEINSVLNIFRQRVAGSA